MEEFQQRKEFESRKQLLIYCQIIEMITAFARAYWNRMILQRFPAFGSEKKFTSLSIEKFHIDTQF